MRGRSVTTACAHVPTGEPFTVYRSECFQSRPNGFRVSSSTLWKVFLQSVRQANQARMSDQDDFMCDDDEDYDLVCFVWVDCVADCLVWQEYSEDSNSEPDVNLENQYYNSKALKETPVKALDSFQRVLELEESEKGEWGFKALKQMIKINFKLVRIHCTSCLCKCPLFAAKLHGDDESVQATVDLHQKCRHSELLREIDQLDSGLHLYFQTGDTSAKLALFLLISLHS